MMNNVIDIDLFQQAAHALPHGLIITDMSQNKQRIVYANPAFLSLTGYTLDEVFGRNCNFLQDIATDSNTVDQIRQAIRDQRAFFGKILNFRKDGSSFWNQLSISPIFDEHHVMTHMVGIQTDISELVQTQSEIEVLMRQDFLTGLANRKALFEFFGSLSPQLIEFPVTICLIDLDRFKSVNDIYGHQTGDALLKAISGRLVQISQEGELVARIGGDEFVFIMQSTANPQQRLSLLNGSYILDSVELNNVSVSIGCAVYTDSSQSLEMILDQADKAMYRQKVR